MVEIRRAREAEFETVVRMHHDRVGERDPDVLRSWYDTHPELFRVAHDGATLVGFALGRARTESSVELAGIAVNDAYTRRGIGSRLLAAFEGDAAGLGFERVSAGSAGGYVDEFYRENGYAPESILVRTTRADRPADYQNRFDVLREREEDGSWKVYVEPDGYDPTRIAAVREYFDDPEAIYIVEKYL